VNTTLKLLKLLRQRREARRDSAATAALRCERRLAQSQQEVARALTALGVARVWREAVLGGQGSPSGNLGEGLMQSCEALVLQRLDAVSQARQAAEKARSDWQEARRLCRECEQACLRTVELLSQRRLLEQQAADLREQVQDEELRLSTRPGVRTAVPARH
jgi:hypothetical protein